MRRLCRPILLAAGLLLAVAGTAGAQPRPPVVVPGPAGDVTILADRIEEIGADNLLVATGNVEIRRGTARLLADRIEINRETGAAVAQGRVIFYDGDDQLTAERIDYNVKTGTGVVHRGEARTAPYYRIGGERMERLSDSVYRVERGIFTTCEDDAPTWAFRFGSATADLEDFIWGTNASFWVKSVPVIPFVPFFAAAIRRERQSGFLFPRFGSSSRRGFFAEVPYFWAISDSQDLTVALDGYERRGLGGNLEYRYVLSEAQRGRLGGFYVREMFHEDDDRGYGTFQHDWQIAPGFSFRADLNVTGDDRVFREYGDLLHQRSAQRAESNVFLARTWEHWNFVGNVLWYQDLTVRRPVELQRVPELKLDALRQPVPGVPGLLYQMEASAVHFVRDVGSNGSRLDLHPRLSYPLSAAGYLTVTPFAGGRLTAYDKTVVGSRITRDEGHVVEVTEDEARVRRLAELGADAETRLSRAYAMDGLWGLGTLVHSIEPRGYYIRLFGRDISRLPNWDRFDRIPEASWLEYSVTNRVRGRTVSPEGTEAARLEMVRFLVAHAYDVQNERPGFAAADLIVQPNGFLRFRGDISSSVEGRGVQSATTDLALILPRLTTTVGTRYLRQPEVPVPEWVQVAGTFNPGVPLPDRASVSFLQGGVSSEVWRNLTVRMNTNFDMRSDTFVENRFGVDVKFQCWALTVEYVDRTAEGGFSRGDDEFRFAVNLLGVGGPIRTHVGVGQ
jgi:LPS-assembly protein